MATQAPPHTDPDAVGQDAFASIARQLDALLEARKPPAPPQAQPTQPTQAPETVDDAPVEPVTPDQLVDLPATLAEEHEAADEDTLSTTEETPGPAVAPPQPASPPTVAAPQNAAAELLSLLGQTTDTVPTAPPSIEPPATAGDRVADVAVPVDIAATADAELAPTPEAEPPVSPADAKPKPASPRASFEDHTQVDDHARAPKSSPSNAKRGKVNDAFAEIDALLSSSNGGGAGFTDMTVDQPGTPGRVGGATQPAMGLPSNPTSADLDAELASLLAESPIDPEVLDAAQEIAQRDAEEAERNQDALRERAQEAAQALAKKSKDRFPSINDWDAPNNPDPSDGADHSTEFSHSVDFASPEDSAELDEAIDAAQASDTDEPVSGLEDDITAEINSLLAAEAAEAQAASEIEAEALADTQPPQDTEQALPAGEDPTIDQIDQMLAEGVEDDDQIDGGFFSADDVAADNLRSGGEPLPADTQPVQDDPAHTVTPGEGDDTRTADDDPLTLLQQLVEYLRPALRFLGRLTLECCWLINWPARKFLSMEWRSTLGYIALLQAVGALVVWLYLVVL